MHEFTIALALVEEATQAGLRVGARRVVGLTCRIGDLRMVDSSLLSEAFSVASEGTPCAGANVVVEKSFMQAQCPQCRHHYAVLNWQWACPGCGAEGSLVGGGDELELETIEVEEDDEDSGTTQRL